MGNRLRSDKSWALIAGRTWSSGLLCFDEQILVGVPAHKRCTGILGGSYVADRVDPLIEKTLGDHQAPADPADGLEHVAPPIWMVKLDPVPPGKKPNRYGDPPPGCTSSSPPWGVPAPVPKAKHIGDTFVALQSGWPGTATGVTVRNV